MALYVYIDSITVFFPNLYRLYSLYRLQTGGLLKCFVNVYFLPRTFYNIIMTEEGLNMKPNCPYTILDGINMKSKYYKHYTKIMIN